METTRDQGDQPRGQSPNENIAPIYRSDGSGTSYNFTDYLSHVSKAWKNKVGKGTQPNFPTGVGARGSSGVAGKLTTTPGGITYVDVAYSLKNKFTIAKIKNRAGKFQLPGLVQIRAAADSIKKLRNSQNAFTAVDPNPRQPKAYPICTFTWVIIPQKTSKAPELKKFVDWALTKGQSYGPKLLFVQLPNAVKKAVGRRSPRSIPSSARKAAPNVEPAALPAAGFDVSAGGLDHVLDDREARPLPRVVRARSERKNRSNSRGTSSSGTPVPSSATSSTASSPSRRSVIVQVAPSPA